MPQQDGNGRDFAWIAFDVFAVTEGTRGYAVSVERDALQFFIENPECFVESVDQNVGQPVAIVVLQEEGDGCVLGGRGIFNGVRHVIVLL